MRGVFLTTDLMFFSRVVAVAAENKWDLLALSTMEEAVYRAGEKPASLVLIDLTTRDLDLPALLADLKALDPPPQAFVAFGPHVHKSQLNAAREAGCDEVLTRGQFDSQMAEVLGRYLANGH